MSTFSFPEHKRILTKSEVTEGLEKSKLEVMELLGEHGSKLKFALDRNEYSMLDKILTQGLPRNEDAFVKAQLFLALLECGIKQTMGFDVYTNVPEGGKLENESQLIAWYNPKWNHKVDTNFKA